MAKVAKLVCVSLMTRIVVEDNLTEEQELEEIRKQAYPNFFTQLNEDGVGDHLESYEDDEECPYGTMEGEE